MLAPILSFKNRRMGQDRTYGARIITNSIYLYRIPDCWGDSPVNGLARPPTGGMPGNFLVSADKNFSDGKLFGSDPFGLP